MNVMKIPERENFTKEKKDNPKLLFEIVMRLVKETKCYKEVEPEIDYVSSTDDESSILTSHLFEFAAFVRPGGNEGTYIWCYIVGEFDSSGNNKCFLGSIKSLGNDAETFEILGRLAGTMAYCASVYTNKYIDLYS